MEKKAVIERGSSIVIARRYRCTDCRATFRAYPHGVDAGRLTLRARGLAALLFALGLSIPETSRVLAALGTAVSPTTIWRHCRRYGRAVAPSVGHRIVVALPSSGNETAGGGGQEWIAARIRGGISSAEAIEVGMTFSSQTLVRQALDWMRRNATAVGFLIEEGNKGSPSPE
jgi:transposase-like protein